MSHHDKAPQTPQDIAKSYLALNTLRDYVYQQKPKRFLASDFVEDIPSLRPFGTTLNNVLPSAVTVEGDPEARRKQVAQAVQKMEHAGRKEHPVVREALTGAAKFGLGSIPLSLGLGLAEKSLHIPKLKKLFKGEMPRITLKENFATPQKRQELKRYLIGSAKAGVAQGAFFGMTPPLLSNSSSFKPEHLHAAAKLMNEHPNLSALPGADLAALRNQELGPHDTPIKRHIQNAVGAGIAGGTGALAVQGFRAGSSLLHNPLEKGKAKASNVWSNLLRRFAYLGNNDKPGDTPEVLATKLKNRTELDPYVPKPYVPKLRSPKRVGYAFRRPISWKGMRKPVIGLTLLGAGLAGAGSYLSHPKQPDHV